MDENLKKMINRFYAEMDKDVSYDLGEIACYLVPKLHHIIEQLEQENLQLYEKLNIVNDSIDKLKYDINGRK